MLTSSFCHFPGIGPKTERKIWASGIHSWHQLLEPAGHDSSPLSYRKLLPHASLSIHELQRKNAAFFARHMPRREMWRLFSEFRESTAYVDIETTGLSRGPDHITCIAVFDGRKVKTYVYGENLEAFADDILHYQLVVTFNGSCFDIPFIERELSIEIPHAHIDLRFLLKSLGFSGGLKVCEKRIGLDRGILADVDGYLAVLLWREYQLTGERAFLETLLAYNIEDVLSLEPLLVEAYNLKLKTLPRDLGRVPQRKGTGAANPFQPHPRALARIL